MTAPRMVHGSITRMRSQSIRGLLLNEWRLPILKNKLAHAPPTIVKLERATADFAGKSANNQSAAQRQSHLAHCDAKTSAWYRHKKRYLSRKRQAARLAAKGTNKCAAL